MLASLVNSNAYSDEHVSAGVIMAGVFASTRDLDREVRDHKHEVREKIGQLESVLERLELLEDFDPLTDMLNRSFGAQTARSGARPALPRSRNHEPGAQPPPSRLTDVFIVHGHDRQARAELARFVERVGLKPIILEEQADAGLTIVEKFERDASRAGAAIVLLTPDDVGGTKDTSPPELRGRARQNVIFELGYFAGKFGRGRVCALVRGHLEIPSDYNGVMYVTMDDHDGWKLKLARNLKDSGLPVDLSRLL
jgi:predicted nucleotide-binding protein